jgi:hypothetical protein
MLWVAIALVSAVVVATLRARCLGCGRVTRATLDTSVFALLVAYSPGAVLRIIRQTGPGALRLRTTGAPGDRWRAEFGLDDIAWRPARFYAAEAWLITQGLVPEIERHGGAFDWVVRIRLRGDELELTRVLSGFLARVCEGLEWHASEAFRAVFAGSVNLGGLRAWAIAQDPRRLRSA